jgi:hypothetical protein
MEVEGLAVVEMQNPIAVGDLEGLGLAVFVHG